MIEKITEKIISDMAGRDMDDLRVVLLDVLSDYDISYKKNDIMCTERGWMRELEMFLARKRLEGRSDGTINQYELHLSRMLTYINKPVNDITEYDLFSYLMMYKNSRNVSNVYLDIIRRTFSSFFGWLCRKGYIQKNPSEGLDAIKSEKKIKKPLSDTELEMLRRSCDTKRDIALLEFLYSTGVRVSELTALEKKDVNFSKMDVFVYGKGAKEREVYLTPTACMYLDEYLSSRKDSEDALFVSIRYPHKRMSKSGIEARLHQIGESAGVENVHPHRLRRTMATNILAKGMPIEEVKEILGHSKLDTTMIYCDINKENIKHHHKKYMSA